MENIRFPFVLDLSILTDEQLKDLANCVYCEQQERVNRKINAGMFPSLDNEEKLIYRTKGKIEAIKAYRSRTNLSLYEAKAVLDRAFP